MAEQGSMGLQGEGGRDVSFTVGSGRVSLRRFYLNKDQWGWKSELWRGPGEACSSKRRQQTPKALTGSTECMRTGKETVCHFSLHRAAGPLPFLSCGKAKPGVHVMARDRDGTDSTPNSFPLCSSGTYSVIFVHYLWNTEVCIAGISCASSLL